MANVGLSETPKDSSGLASLQRALIPAGELSDRRGKALSALETDSATELFNPRRILSLPVKLSQTFSLLGHAVGHLPRCGTHCGKLCLSFPEV